MSYQIENRPKKSGKPSYRARVTIKQDGRILYRDGKTFPQRRDAVSWGARRNKELMTAMEAGLDDFAAATGEAERVSSFTLKEAIERYRAEYAANFGRTVAKDLDLLARAPLAVMKIAEITSADIVRHIKRRRDGFSEIRDGRVVEVGGIAPSTASNDLTRLQTVFDAADASFNMVVPRDELKKARRHCLRERLIGKPNERERTATNEELGSLCNYFDQSNRATIPMSDIIMFAVYSARRQDEITQLRWEDNDHLALTGVVPRLKDPRGHRVDVPFRYTQEAWDIVQRQPRINERIFPYNSRSISSAFTRACQFLQIDDLRFHDLRHTAVTRLFKLGYGVHEVPLFSLHRSWVTLKRYTNIKPADLELR